MNIQRRWWEVLSASVLTAGVTSLLTNPIEVLKLKSQARLLHSCNSYCIATACESSLPSKINFQDCFRGMLYGSKVLALSNIIFLNAYELVLSTLRSGGIQNTSASFCSSVLARLLSTTLTIPLQTARIQKSLQIPSRRFGTKGLKTTLARDLIFSGLYWPTVEYCRNLIVGEEYRNSSHTWNQMIFCNLVPATIVGTVIALVTSPLDHLKTLVQGDLAKQSNLLEEAKKLAKHWRDPSLLNGAKYRVIKAGVHCPVFLLSYQLIWQQIKATQIQL